MSDEAFMRLAIAEAERALEHDDVPIGAVVVRDGEVIGAGRNERELDQDPTAHAEILALREAARAVGHWRILDSTIYVTLEPCAMCAGAIVLARVPRVVFGTVDPKAGAAGSVLDVLGEPRLNHRPDVAGGPLPPEAAGGVPPCFPTRGGVGGPAPRFLPAGGVAGGALEEPLEQSAPLARRLAPRLCSPIGPGAADCS